MLQTKAMLQYELSHIPKEKVAAGLGYAERNVRESLESSEEGEREGRIWQVHTHLLSSTKVG